MGVGIDIVEADPGRAAFAGSKLAKVPRNVGHVGAHVHTPPLASFMFYINTIGRCVLADDEQFLRPGRDELFGLAQHRVDAAADQLSAQVGDDAESAAMVAALADRSDEHTSELQSLMRISYAVFCWTHK